MALILWVILTIHPLASFAGTCALPGSQPGHRDWAFFDLGDTLVDTSQGVKAFELMPGAFEYLKQLKENNYRLGLISNIPVSWGKNFTERLSRLKKEIASNLKPGQRPFPWSDFEVIFLPESEDDYKPNPNMFLKALSKVKTDNHQIYFQGENSTEVQVARELGFISHQIEKQSDRTPFLPCAQMTPQR